jgi:hypothetical protein
VPVSRATIDEYTLKLNAGQKGVEKRILAPTKAGFGIKFPVGSCGFGYFVGRAAVTTLQAICLGAMLAWTPSVVVLAWLLREAPLDELDELQRDPS